MLRRKGTTLIETLIGIAILAFVMTFALAMFSLSTEKLARSKHRVLATALANEQVEIIRNLPYAQVGTGAPTCEVTGTMPRTSTVVRSNVSYTIDTCVKWVDDPFDGCVGTVTEQPNQSRCADGTIVNKSPDTIPTDYKLAQVTVAWPGGDTPIKLVSTVAPKGLESPSNTGSLLLSVFDASGLPVPTAHVLVTNSNLGPTADRDSYTDNQGKLQLLGLAPDVNNYHVVVTKSGYTTDQTYAISAGVPNPVLQDFSITAGGILGASFTIDRVSSLAFSTVSETCTVIPSIGFNLKGQHVISNPGVPPPPDAVLKYDTNFTTDSSGHVTASNLEWDQYTLTLGGSSHTIAGIIPPASLNVLPNTNILVQLVLSGSYSTNSLLANVKDANTNLPVSGATVDVAGVGVQTTGQGSWSQTDWSGGGGEPLFSDATKTKFATEDGNIDWVTTPGQVTLQQATAADSVTESFTTDTAKDPSTTANWDTSAGELRLPQTSGQYEATAFGQSLRLPTIAGRITSATLTATDQANGQTIQYALAADGTTYEDVTAGVAHTFAATGDDLRFRVTLGTSDPAVTPVVSGITIALTVETYASSATLTSSTFDTGTTSSFIGLTWNPESQGGNVGVDAVRFQLAANDDNATWDFVGPDGTAATYFTTSGTSVPAALQAKRYVRYKLYLQTADRKFTPGISDVSLGYTTGCTPPGQSFFPNLSATTYSVTITKAGYAPLTVDVDVNGNVQNTFSLTPN